MILIYARVSTQDQAREGATSIAEQQRKGKAIAQLRGAGQFDAVSYVDTDVSGSIPLRDRPEGSRMLADAKKGDCVVASKLDRLFRSAVDALRTAEELAARGVDLVLVDMGVEPVTGNGTAKLFFSMLSVFAEFERHRIAERMNDGRAAKKRQGLRVSGHPPYGYRFEGEKPHTRLVPVDHEIEVIRIARECWKRTSPAAATRLLNERGLRDRSGHEFRITQVRRLAKRVEVMQ